MNRYITLFWIVIGSIAMILVGMIYLLFSFDSSPEKSLLPDSALAQPVLDSPEARAFLARYPDAESYIFQDFTMLDCCDVTLSYVQNETEVCITDEYGYLCAPQGPGTRLDAQVNVSADLKNITVASMSLFCSAEIGEHPGHWTVGGDIVQNLRPENPDCWDIGPPPRPSDAELIEMAKNTTEGTTYLAIHADNEVIFDDSNLYQETVTFTPSVSEPVQFVAFFDKADWNIDRIAIRCSNGHYHDSSIERLSLYFQPQHGCLDSVHSKIEAANQTLQAKAFLAKYPDSEPLSGNFSASNSTIQYTHEKTNEQAYADVARLVVIFQGNSDNIIDFEIACYNSADMNNKHVESGRQLNVESFLQNSLCP